MNLLESVFQKTEDGERLTREDVLTLLRSRDLLSMGRLASGMAKRKNRDRPGVVSYIVDRNINYSNICVARCKFCAFYRQKGEEGAYLLSENEIFEKIEETISLGGVQILLQGGLHPDLKIDYYVNLLAGIRGKFPGIHIHAFSPPEIIHVAELSGLSIKQTITILKEAGLGSIPGGGAEILSDGVRENISPAKCSTIQWLKVMEEAHELGLRSSATMMFGHLETDEDIADHLLSIRNLQDRTGGFTAFIPWTFQSENTRLSGGKAPGGFGYLRLVAISRIILDNVQHLQASWVTQGPKIAQMALFFGADDMGSTMIEENVVKAAGVSFRMSSEEISALIMDAGLTPARRRNDYSLIEAA